MDISQEDLSTFISSRLAPLRIRKFLGKNCKLNHNRRFIFNTVFFRNSIITPTAAHIKKFIKFYALKQ